MTFQSPVCISAVGRLTEVLLKNFFKKKTRNWHEHWKIFTKDLKILTDTVFDTDFKTYINTNNVTSVKKVLSYSELSIQKWKHLQKDIIWSIRIHYLIGVCYAALFHNPLNKFYFSAYYFSCCEKKMKFQKLLVNIQTWKEYHYLKLYYPAPVPL